MLNKLNNIINRITSGIFSLVNIKPGNTAFALLKTSIAATGVGLLYFAVAEIIDCSQKRAERKRAEKAEKERLECAALIKGYFERLRIVADTCDQVMKLKGKDSNKVEND